jgi:glycosyltransferase involved in cell wall biosynthesis
MHADNFKDSPRLGYLLRTFPVLSETFVAGEIRTVADLTGHPPVVAALYRPGSGQAGQWNHEDAPPVRYWGDIDRHRLGDLAMAHASLLARNPANVIRVTTQTSPEGLSFKDRVKAASLAKFFLSHGVGHIHSHFAWEHADILAYLHRLTGLPYSLTLHAADIFVDQASLYRRTAGAAFVGTISKFNREWLTSRLGLPHNKIKVVHCGVDLEKLSPDPCPETWPPRVVSIGRMVPKKGFEVLLKALAMLCAKGVAFEADLVGDGPLRPELERLAGNLGLSEKVRFHGALAPKEAISRMKNGHVFALACRVGPDGDMDGIPVALMEAMALGRPVVSTCLSGIPELVAEGCGLMAEPGDPGSLAEKLQLLLTNEELARDLAVRGQRRVERAFTLQAQARMILDLVRSVRRSVVQ